MQKPEISSINIAERLQRCVLECPDQIAFYFIKADKTEYRITYRELDKKATLLAAQLQKSGSYGQTALIFLGPGFDYISAFFGCLYAGIIAVPAYPPRNSRHMERLKSIIKNCDAEFIITNNKIAQQFKFDTKIIIIDSENNLTLPFLPVKISNNSTAFLQYSSGSTGNPKGVIISHDNIVNNCEALRERFGDVNLVKFCSWLPPYHDMGIVAGIILPIYLQKPSVLMSPQSFVNDPFLWLETISKYQVSCSAAPNFAYDLCVQKLQNCKSLLDINLSSWKAAINGAEPVRCETIEQFIESFKPYGLMEGSLYAVYGMAEATVFLTSAVFSSRDSVKKIDVQSYQHNNLQLVNDDSYNSYNKIKSLVNCGKIISNHDLIIIDPIKNHKLTFFQIGEICVKGPSITEGYWKDDDLTKKAFYEDNKTLYLKTGDLGFLDTDNNLYISGRVKELIIVNGRNFYPDDIVQSIDQIHKNLIPHSSAAFNIIDNDKEKLVIIQEISRHANNIHEIFDLIISNIAEDHAIVPFEVVLIKQASLPKTSSGKIQHQFTKKLYLTQSLSVVESWKQEASEESIKPRNELEIMLCKIWQDALGLEAVGIKDDFFKVGGTSILAIKTINAINMIVNCNVQVSDLYTYRTIELICRKVCETKGNFKYKEFCINEKLLGEVYGSFDITNVQQAYLYGRLGKFDLGNTSTHLYMELNFNILDIDRLQSSFNHILQRHSALRATFKDGKQFINKFVKLYNFICHVNSNEDKLMEVRDLLSHKVYEPEKYPLFDIEISQCDHRYIVHFSIDALIMDAESLSIFFTEWSQIYNNPQTKLPPLTISFEDYICSYVAIRNSQLYKEAKRYWETKLFEYDFSATLPLKSSLREITKPTFKRISQIIDRNIWKKICNKAEHHNLSQTSIILAVYGRILSYWSGRENFCVTLTLFNRLPVHSQINSIVGDFTQLELFNYRRDNGVILQNLTQTHNELWTDLQHNLFDGIDVQRLFKKENQFDVNHILSPVVLTSILGNKKILGDFNGFDKIGYSISQTSQIYLDNKAYETEDGFIAEWDYVEQLFDSEIIEQMHNAYCNLIKYLADTNWDQDFATFVPPLKDEQIVLLANSTTQAKVTNTLITAFEANLHSSSNDIAVIDHSSSYTYRELSKKCNVLAQNLYQKGAKKGDLIAVLSEKGYQQVVATLGILKSGAAYLPLNIEWPLTRVAEILQDGLVRQLVVTTAQSKRIKNTNIINQYEIIILEELSNIEYNLSILNLIPPPKANDLAYVIFTSGSTGKPKGVMISHEGAINTIQAVNQRFQVSKNDKILALSELSFDLSVYDIFGLLLVGGAIVFPDQSKPKEPEHWYQLIVRHKITLWNTVPQLMQMLCDYISVSKQTLPDLRLALLSGDWLPLSLPQHIKSLNPAIDIISLGGATEGSIWSIWYEITTLNPSWQSIPYGSAMPNQKMHILNQFGEECPIGVAGEIYIGGQGVALGYWNDKNKTLDSFIIHTKLGRLYKTGDLGVWHQDAYIEFLGRKDDQVKIGGYRIELGEIEAHLIKFPNIQQSIVDIKGTPRQLVAYVVFNNFIIENVIKDSFERTSFKMAKHGIRRFMTNTLTIELPQPRSDWQLIEEYYRRKSYRSFHGSPLTKNQIEQWLCESQQQNKVFNESQPLTFDLVNELLLELMALSTDHHVLPKYRYASAGSLYPVQIYVEFNTNKISMIPAGIYYYNPEEHKLHLISTKCNSENESVAFYLIGIENAIQPLYGNLSKDFCTLESGYINGLLETKAQKLKLNMSAAEILQTDLLLKQLDLTANNYCIQQLSFGQIDDSLYLEKLYVYVYVKSSKVEDLDGGWYQYNTELSQLCKINNSLVLDSYLMTGENGALFHESAYIVFIAGDDKQLVEAGKLSQKLMDCGSSSQIGICPLGLADTIVLKELASVVPHTLLHILVCGSISLDQSIAINNSEANTNYEPLRIFLSRTLPDYMIPRVFIFLDELPITSNGKINRKALPEPHFKATNEYIAPTNPTEEKICLIWQELLNIPKVGITDDFFRLGGNSILATQITYRMNQLLQSHIPVSALFQYKTVYDLLNSISFNKQIPRINRHLGDTAPLSPSQERLLFIEKYEEGTNAYNIPIVLSLYSDIDIESFQKSLDAIIERHEIFRTIYKQDATGQYYQQILTAPLLITIEEIDQIDLEQKIAIAANHIFDLENNYSIQVWIYRTTNSKYYTLINIHHIAFDGWSTDIFIKELHAYYQYFSQQIPVELSELTVQYKDFAIWQQESLSGEEYNKKLIYWQHKLQHYELLLLPTDKRRQPLVNYHGDNVNFEFDIDLSAQLRDLAKEKHTSLYVVLLSGFYVLLNKYSGQSDIVIGTPVANRASYQLENLIGFFVNNLVLRESVENTLTLDTLIAKTHQNLSEAQKYQDIPFEKVVELLNTEKDLSRHPLFQVMFGVQNFGTMKPFTKQSTQFFEQLISEDYFHVARFDLSLFINDAESILKGSCKYATSLYNRGTIERLVGHYINILKQMVATPKITISKIQLLTYNEYQKSVYQWNNTQESYSKNSTLVQLFEDQVEKTPNSVALVFQNNKLTYHELNVKSNQLARYIKHQYQERIQLELSPNTLIAIGMERCLEIVIGVLGVLKAGAAYLPLDITHPVERIKYLLSESNSKLILTQTDSVNLFSQLVNEENNGLTMVNLDTVPYNNENLSNLDSSIRPEHLAYVIYTSGTTGAPKGVMIEHQNVVNYVSWMFLQKDFVKQSRVDCSSVFTFDATVQMLWVPLLCGNVVVLCPTNIKNDPNEYIQYIAANNIQAIKLTPSYLNILLNIIDCQQEALSTLKCLIIGGEAISQTDIDNYLAINPQSVVMYHYGPTETTVGSLIHWITSKDDSTEVILGKPAHNTRCYVLDSNYIPLPIGVSGELYIGGDGVGRGYLNQTELTSQRFIKSPFLLNDFDNSSKSRLYKTGDLVKWTENGTLKYLGRNDSQVKIRGYRIELAEIEMQLSKHPSIKQAIVISNDDDFSNKHLIAYYIGNAPLTHTQIKSYLASKLPDYMVPSYFIALKSIPLTKNGKLNRESLPKPEFHNQLITERVAPSTHNEKIFHTIWQEVLKIEQIGIYDNFFEMGGNSLLIIRVAYLAKKHGIPITPKLIYSHPTISGLSEAVQVVNPNNYNANIPQKFILSPPQLRLLELYEDNINYFNSLLAIGSKEPFELKVLKQSLDHLINHYSLLRSKINKEGTGYTVEVINDATKDYTFIKIDCNDMSIDALNKVMNETVKEALSKIDIFLGNLVAVVYLENTKLWGNIVLINLHHLFFDARSKEIFLIEFKKLYKKYLEHKSTTGQIIIHKLVDNSYFNWAESLLTNAVKQNVQVNKSSWINKLTKKPWFPTMNLLDSLGIAENIVVYNYSDSIQEIESYQSNARTKLSLERALIFSFILAIVNCFKVNQEIVFHLLRDSRVIGKETEQDYSDVIGFFSDALPIIIDLNKHSQFEDLEVSLELINKLSHQLDYHLFGMCDYPALVYVDPNIQDKQILQNFESKICAMLNVFTNYANKDTYSDNISINHNFNAAFLNLPQKRKLKYLLHFTTILDIPTNKIHFSVMYSNYHYDSDTILEIIAKYTYFFKKIILL